MGVNNRFTSMDPRLTKWLQWLEIIRLELHDLLLYRRVFWDVQEIIKTNRAIHTPSVFYSFLGHAYAAYAVAAIRRQIKRDKKSVSLARLLEELVAYPQVLSRSYFVSLYKGSPVENLADSDFTRLAETKGTHVSKDMVAADLGNLKLRARKCEEWADRRLAHRDERDVTSPPTFIDVDESVDILDKLYVKYHLLFRAGSYDTLEPVVQYDWKAVFREPWIGNAS